MVALPQSYNPAEVEASTGGSGVVIPPGEYKVQVVSSEEKPTKAGNGAFIEFVYLITDGEYQNNKIWDRFNVDNPNPQAVEIGLSQFKQLAEACGSPDCTDTDELTGCQFIAVMGPQKNDPNRTEVKSRAVASGATKKSTVKTTTTQAATTTAKKGPSWAK